MLSVLLSGAFGTALGLIAGYRRGWVEIAVMRIADVFLSIPAVLLAIITVAVLGPSLVNVVLVLALTFHFGAALAGVMGAVRRAARLPPAEAMRPEPPASFRPAFIERTGIAHVFSHSFRIAVRNLERRPAQAFFTVAGLSLATALLIIPNCFRDSVSELLAPVWFCSGALTVSSHSGRRASTSACRPGAR